MNEMLEVVIKIPKQTYDYLMNLYKERGMTDFNGYAENAIANGIVLPKGHGRLIDADKALDYFTTNMNWVDEDDNRIDNSDERKAIFKDYFDGVPTSIEADKEVENDN